MRVATFMLSPVPSQPWLPVEEHRDPEGDDHALAALAAARDRDVVLPVLCASFILFHFFPDVMYTCRSFFLRDAYRTLFRITVVCNSGTLIT